MTKYYLILLLILFSCRSKHQEETARMYWYHIYHHSQPEKILRDTSTLKYERWSIQDTSFYRLGNFGNYQFVYDALIIDNMICPLIGGIQYEFNGETKQLRKYSFDHPDIVDEESYYFFDGQRLVAIYNWTMGPLIIFDHNKNLDEVSLIYDQIVNRK